LTIALAWIPNCVADEPADPPGEDEGPLDHWPHCQVFMHDDDTNPPTYTLDPTCLLPLPPIGP
jgi:hypothetical protein